MQPEDGVIIAGHWAIISDDPEREAAIVGPHVLYQSNQYIEWGAFGPPDQLPRFPDAQAAIANGLYELWDARHRGDPPHRVARGSTPRSRDLHFWAQFPGEPIEPRDSGASNTSPGTCCRACVPHSKFKRDNRPAQGLRVPCRARLDRHRGQCARQVQDEARRGARPETTRPACTPDAGSCSGSCAVGARD